MQRLWSLYNKFEQLRIDNLKSEHVRIILLSIPMHRMIDWYACQEGDIHWQPIANIPEFYEDVRQIKGRKDLIPPKLEESQAPPSPNSKTSEEARRPLFEEVPQSIDNAKTATIALEVESTKERRSARRYPRILKFIAATPSGERFETETKDVSMSGLALVNDLPPSIDKRFRAELWLNNNCVQVACTRVNSNTVKLDQASSWDLIRAWIVNW